MNPLENFINQISDNRRLLIRDPIPPSPDDVRHCKNLRVERIVVTTMSATFSLSLILLLIWKLCICRANHPPDNRNDPTQPKPSIDEELASIPVLVYGVSTLPTSPASNSGDCNLALELDSCAICLKDYVHGESVRVLPRCKHMFHKKCIEEWLQVPSLHCPLCRDRVLDNFLQSTRSDNCTNIQRDGIPNPFTSSAFNYRNMHNYGSYPSMLGGFT